MQWTKLSKGPKIGECRIEVVTITDMLLSDSLRAHRRGLRHNLQMPASLVRYFIMPCVIHF